jgi:hypothetical protein
VGPAAPGPGAGPGSRAEHDGFFTAGEVRRTAAAYGTEAELLAGMGHDLMLDHGWERVADRIHTWVRQPPVGGWGWGSAASSRSRSRARWLRREWW